MCVAMRGPRRDKVKKKILLSRPKSGNIQCGKTTNHAYTSRAGQAGGGSFKEKTISQRKNLPIECAQGDHCDAQTEFLE